jgi:hypothetical protein
MRSEFTKRAAPFLAMVVAGYFLGIYLDQRFTSDEAFYLTASNDRTETPAPTTSTATTSAAACVRKDGSWKNWPWPNVPALSPKCADDR